MGDFATLITGPSGTGKELVARAIAQSRYAPVRRPQAGLRRRRSRRRFSPSTSRRSRPRWSNPNCSAIAAARSPARSATAKAGSKPAPALGSVFLDELGDLDPAIQVKLLRVIETRTFHPVGDTASRQFHGKLIAATNRDLAARHPQRPLPRRSVLPPMLGPDRDAIAGRAARRFAAGACSELIVYMARGVAGAEARRTGRRSDWLDRQNISGHDYAWPGNYRELEQCVKNVLIRRDYRPSRPRQAEPRRSSSSRSFARGQPHRGPAAVALLHASSTAGPEVTKKPPAVYGIDRRTVKSKVDVSLLAKLSVE